MLAILYPPMPSDGVAVSLRAHLPAADEITHLFARLLARHRPLHVIAPHNLQLLPQLLVSYPFGIGDDRDPALLGSAVALLLLILIRLALDLRVIHRGAQAVHYVISQPLLV